LEALGARRSGLGLTVRAAYIASVPVDIQSLTRAELASRFEEWGQPAYRVDQLLEWLYRHRARTWDAMTNLPKALREQLRQNYALGSLELVRTQGSSDTTQKFLWRLGDGALIESVLIPANPALYGEPTDRHTLCVSTQVGCAYGCKFCASGLEGWKRNLGVEEMVDQVLAVERFHQSPKSSEVAGPPLVHGTRDMQHASPDPQFPIRGPRSPISPAPRLIDNLVIMGMGEPLANYDNLLKALRILNAPWGGGIGARKITISTSGLVPQIRRLATEPLQLRLALSLHGATDEVRSRIMPVNRKYPLRELVAACEYYQERKGRMITLEYILIAGVNDGLDQAGPLAQLARRLHAKANLIPYNQVEGLPWQRPTEAAQERFLAGLQRLKIPATLRREKGHDIDAACGQLRLRTEREIAATRP
jgi:23S rRNA (adenine2503-C2)-methyltransferase